MKNKLLPLFVALGSYSAYSQVGVGTLTPNSSAQLDITSKDKGLLIPQIALKSSTDTETIKPGNVESLLVFNTSTIADITPGYYYWYKGRWNRIAISGEGGGKTETAVGEGVPGKKGDPGYPGEGVVIYTNTKNGDVYVQNPDGTWTKINGKDGNNGKDGMNGGNGAPGARQ
ncbi:hypothetical protein [Flavobacterium panacagri]|uniref:hypothetical protein n=1 Tax=Flavobacterium panacagri TaxID=3034146 RepID=UPI0025A650A3|nr:hypothetical protein [Flavobacterium panacagri]